MTERKDLVQKFLGDVERSQSIILKLIEPKTPKYVYLASQLKSSHEYFDDRDVVTGIDVNELQAQLRAAIVRAKIVESELNDQGQHRNRANWQLVKLVDRGLQQGFVDKITGGRVHEIYSPEARSIIEAATDYLFFATHAPTSKFVKVCDVCFEAMLGGRVRDPGRAAREYCKRRDAKLFILPVSTPPRPRGGRPRGSGGQG